MEQSVEPRCEMTSTERDLRELLATKACELFAAYNVPCEAADDAPKEELQLCGVLGFAGERVCGAVVVAASGGALAASNPVRPEASRGWSAELTNQLVGRFKNELRRRGIDVAISIPVVFAATRLVPMPSLPIEPIHLVVGDGAATIWLELEGDVELLASDLQEEVGVEGDILLF